MDSAKSTGNLGGTIGADIFESIPSLDNSSESTAHSWLHLDTAKGMKNNFDGCSNKGGPNKSMSTSYFYNKPSAIKSSLGQRIQTQLKVTCDGKSCYKNYFKGVKDLEAKAQANIISRYEFSQCTLEMPCLPMVGIKINKLTSNAHVQVESSRENKKYYKGTHYFNRTEGKVVISVVAAAKCSASGKGSSIDTSNLDVSLIHPNKDFKPEDNYFGFAERIIYPYFTSIKKEIHTIKSILNPEYQNFELTDAGLEINETLIDIINLSSAVQSNKFNLTKLELDAIDFSRGFLKSHIQKEIKNKVHDNLLSLKNKLTDLTEKQNELFNAQITLKIELLGSEHVTSEEVMAINDLVATLTHELNIDLEYNDYNGQLTLNLPTLHKKLISLINHIDSVQEVVLTQIKLKELFSNS
jgi:hypothetical protein